MSFVRPFALRLARILRPARVRILKRNPWVLFRLRLWGWNVRFMSLGFVKWGARWKLSDYMNSLHRWSKRNRYGPPPGWPVFPIARCKRDVYNPFPSSPGRYQAAPITSPDDSTPVESDCGKDRFGDSSPG